MTCLINELFRSRFSKLGQESWRVTQKVLSYSKHTLLCLYGHNVLGRINLIPLKTLRWFAQWLQWLSINSPSLIHNFSKLDGMESIHSCDQESCSRALSASQIAMVTLCLQLNCAIVPLIVTRPMTGPSHLL